jgi:hypothetical protein
VKTPPTMMVNSPARHNSSSANNTRAM